MQTSKNRVKSDVQSIPVATRVTEPMFKGIQSLLAIDTHLNLSDYLRDLIRKDLKDKGVVFELEKKETEK